MAVGQKAQCGFECEPLSEYESNSNAIHASNYNKWQSVRVETMYAADFIKHSCLFSTVLCVLERGECCQGLPSHLFDLYGEPEPRASREQLDCSCHPSLSIILSPHPTGLIFSKGLRDGNMKYQRLSSGKA